jgi:hypothetical protein
VSTTDIPVSNTLQRLHTLPTSHDPFSSLGLQDPIFITEVNGSGYTTQPLQRFPRGHSRPLDFSSLINTVLIPIGRVTNKTKSKEPRQLASTAQVLCPDPIDGPTAKPTTPQVPLINQLRAPHSTHVVVPLSRVVTQRIGPYREVLRKQPESPKVSQDHHQDNIIVS